MALKKTATKKKTAAKKTAKAPGTPPPKALWSRSAAVGKLTSALAGDPALRQKWLQNRAPILKKFGVTADDVAATAAVLHPSAPHLMMPWPPSHQPQIVVGSATPWSLKAGASTPLDIKGQGFQSGDGVALVSSDGLTRVDATDVVISGPKGLTCSLQPTKKGWYSLIVANKQTQRWGGLMNGIQVT